MRAITSEDASTSGRVERRSKFLYGGPPYLLLIVSTAIAALNPAGQDGTQRVITVSVAAATALWLAFPLIVEPSWSQRRRSVLVFYLVLLALIAALLTRNVVYTVFASVGYAYALGMLPPRLIVWGVTATAVITAGAQILSSHASTPTWRYLLAVDLAVPLLFVGWYVGLQNARRNEVIIELREALEENRGLHAQLLVQAREAGVMEERQRMAREIHDTIAQGLTGIITQLHAATHLAGNDAVQQRHISNAAQLAKESLAEARRSVQALRPSVLEVSRLPEALADIVGKWSGLHDADATLSITGTVDQLDLDTEATLLRVAQEALANVAKHADAAHVNLTLTYLDDIVILDVRDDGRGFEPSSADGAVREDGGFGLVGMRERLERLGGQLEIESSPGSGCVVSAALPVSGARGARDAGGTIG